MASDVIIGRRSESRQSGPTFEIWFLTITMRPEAVVERSFRRGRGSGYEKSRCSTQGEARREAECHIGEGVVTLAGAQPSGADPDRRPPGASARRRSASDSDNHCERRS